MSRYSIVFVVVILTGPSPVGVVLLPLQGSGAHCVAGGVRSKPWPSNVEKAQSRRHPTGHTAVHHRNDCRSRGHALPTWTAVDLGTITRVKTLVYNNIILNVLPIYYSYNNARDCWLLFLRIFICGVNFWQRKIQPTQLFGPQVHFESGQLGGNPSSTVGLQTEGPRRG